METKTKTCKDRVSESFRSCMEDIRTLLHAKDNETPELGSLYEYGLSFELVEAGTFKGQREDYYRWQLSYGGPSSEFRIYKNGEVEYWFLDWYDDAHIQLSQEDAQLIIDILAPWMDGEGWAQLSIY